MPTSPSCQFEFASDLTGFRAPGALVVRLSGRLRRKRDLLGALAAGLKVPNYFGHNWDALEECLRDLSWLNGAAQVVLLHEQLPLANHAQRLLYLDILRGAQRARPQLRVVFPRAVQSQVAG